jgi:hypothetical protein
LAALCRAEETRAWLAAAELSLETEGRAKRAAKRRERGKEAAVGGPSEQPAAARPRERGPQGGAPSAQPGPYDYRAAARERARPARPPPQPRKTSFLRWLFCMEPL